MLAEFTREELAAGADRVVMEMLATAGLRGPPVDSLVLAHRLGLTVVEDDRQEGRARYVRLRGRRATGPRATILLRPEPRAERRHWAVAHEIGEHVACRVFAVWGVDPREAGPRAREEVANALAARLLLPTAWFTSDGVQTGWDLLRLKSYYSTASHELIARRMLDCPPPVIVSMFDQAAISFRRSNVPGRPPPPSPAETQCWRAAHANRPVQTWDGACKIQGWPVHEEGWKREILRTTVDEFPSDG